MVDKEGDATVSTNHKTHALETPVPYEGQVTQPGTPQAERKKCSVEEAANYYDLPPILARFGDWAVCKDGLHCLYVRCHVPKNRFSESDWVEHVTKKPWVNSGDFVDAFEEAKRMMADGRI